MPTGRSTEHQPDADEALHACAARTNFGNRTKHSIVAETAAKTLRPLKKARSGISDELDAAMSKLGITNEVVASRCGVTEKTVREWRGRALLAGEVPKAIPGYAISLLPGALFDEMLLGLRLVHREEARSAGGSR